MFLINGPLFVLATAAGTAAGVGAGLALAAAYHGGMAMKGGRR